jgi:hypothetical protein
VSFNNQWQRKDRSEITKGARLYVNLQDDLVYMLTYYNHSRRLHLFQKCDCKRAAYRDRRAAISSSVRSSTSLWNDWCLTIRSVFSSDTLNEARNFMGDGDFISSLGLDLRAPRLHSYHSSFHGSEYKRILGKSFKDISQI